MLHRGPEVRVALDAEAHHERDRLLRVLGEAVLPVSADPDHPRTRHTTIVVHARRFARKQQVRCVAA
jgi:hypothetical protein